MILWGHGHCAVQQLGGTPFDLYKPFQLSEHYDAVVITDQVGMRKPDPDVFALALTCTVVVGVRPTTRSRRRC
ncbi:MAG: hypothetical protein ACRDSR_22205 [Pseudonocardiaceae bacterium]